MEVKSTIKKSPVLIYTGIFLILILLYYLLFFIEGKSIIWKLDGINQHYSILYDFNEIVREFLKNPMNGFPEWSWSIGYGSDVIGTYSYYVLGDPFSYISLLFPLDKLEIAYEFLICLRLYLSGLAFIVYAKRMNFSKEASILGSISYAFSGFVLMSAVRHPYFINPLIILPLAFVCIENVIENKKKYLFSIIVAISMISNFYFCYMIAIISIIYAFLRYFEVNRIRKVDFKKYFINLILYFFIGILISGIILLPTLYSIFTSSRIVSDNNQSTILLYPISYYVNLIYSSISSGSYPFWTMLTSPILTFIFLPLFFRYRKEHSTYFYMTIIFFFMTLIPIFGSIMNGLSSISNRWTLVFTFVSSVIICVGFDNLKRIRKKDILWMFYILLFFGVFAVMKTEVKMIKNQMFPSLFLGAMTIGAILYYLKVEAPNNIIKNSRSFFLVILILLSINIAFNNYYRYTPNGQNYVNQFMDKNKSLNYYENSFNGAEKYIKEIDQSFYRTSKTDNVSRGNTRNNSLILNYNGIDSYLSVNNGYLSEFSRTLNNRSFTPNSPIINFDNRYIVSNIMGVKYYIGKKNKDPHLDTSIKKIKDVKNFSIYEKNDVMPFGYVYSNVLSEDKFDELNGLEKEESLAYTASVDDNYIESNVESIKSNINNILFDTSGSTAKVTKDKIIVTEPNQKVVLKIKDEKIPSGELYVNIDGLKYAQLSNEHKDKKSTSLKDIIMPFIRTSKGDGFTVTASYKDVSKSFVQPDSLDASGYFDMDATLINLGYYDEKINDNKPIVLKFKKPGEYSFESLEILNLPIREYEDEFSKLKENSMNIDSISSDKVLGSINSSVDGVITFQIPYSKGWKLKIDDKSVETFAVNKAFLGAKLDAGNHKIELTYETPFLNIGMICSAVGIVILILLLIMEKRSKR